MLTRTTSRKSAAVSFLASPHHGYEDSSRLLTAGVPIVQAAGRGMVLAVFDGIGSAPQGKQAADHMAKSLESFFHNPEVTPATWEYLSALLYQANCEIHAWGYVPGTSLPLGGCVGTIAWYLEDHLIIFHAGDTVGMVLTPDGEVRTLTRLHESREGITRYFGMGTSLRIDIESTSVDEGDLILLVSDGVTKAYSNEEAAALVKDLHGRTNDLGQIAQELVQLSRACGSKDEITVVLAEIEEE